jgi:hypothetical protein
VELMLRKPDIGREYRHNREQESGTSAAVVSGSRCMSIFLSAKFPERIDIPA